MLRIQPIKVNPAPQLKQLQFSQEKLLEYLRLDAGERRLRRAPVDESIFFDEAIRDIVWQRCSGKCVYCERHVSRDEGLDHHRPLRDARNMDGTSHRDSYTWLAYELENLTYTCRACRSAKGTIFPVKGLRAAYLTRITDVYDLEKPMILDPYRDQIGVHFDFLYDGFCVAKTDRGLTTVDILNLNRPDLINARSSEIKSFLHDLEETVNSLGDRYLGNDLLDFRAQFTGVRINILQRILKGQTIEGKVVSVGATNIVSSMHYILGADISPTERDRIRQRIQHYRYEDSKRAELYRRQAALENDSKVEDNGQWNDGIRHGVLENVRIDNFKGIQNLHLSIPARKLSRTASCLMLLGENSAGKSSILQAIALAILGSADVRRLKLKSREYLRSRRDGRWDQLTAEDAVALVEFESGAQSHFRLDSKLDKSFGNKHANSIVLGYGARRYFDRSNNDVSDNASARVRTLFHAKATIPFPGAWLDRLNSAQFEQVAQVIRIVLTLSEQDRLIRDDENGISVVLDGQPVPLELLSEGYKSVIAMTIDIMRELLPSYPILEESEAIVLIDEIETHLHPRWKMRIMSALRQSFPRVQFIVTTHDPLCLRGMDDGEVVVLQHTGDGSVEKLENLPDVRSMRADQLLTSDYFGLSSTIDPKLELDMTRYVNNLRDWPDRDGTHADHLISELTIGNSAQEQIIHSAMRRFLKERETPRGRPRSEISQEAIEAVLAALMEAPDNDIY